jgi:peroxiredoxin Q/BCP
MLIFLTCGRSPAARYGRLQPGQPAEDFQVEDIFGRPVRLIDFKGRKLLLAFFRYASCPLCNLRISSLIREYETLQAKGLDVVAFFQSPSDSIRQYVGRQDAPFPIVADPDRVIYKLYGVESSWPKFILGSMRLGRLTKAAFKGFFPGKMEGSIPLVPADFLIGPDLTIAQVYYGKDISDHMPLEDIKEWLEW